MLIRRLTHREAYTSGIYLRLDRDHPSISEIKVPIIRMALLVPEAALQRPYLGKQKIARRSESRKQHRMLAAFTDGQVTCGSIGAPYVGSEHNNPRTSRLSSTPCPRTHGVLGVGAWKEVVPPPPFLHPSGWPYAGIIRLRRYSGHPRETT